MKKYSERERGLSEQSEFRSSRYISSWRRVPEGPWLGKNGFRPFSSRTTVAPFGTRQSAVSRAGAKPRRETVPYKGEECKNYETYSNNWNRKFVRRR